MIHTKQKDKREINEKMKIALEKKQKKNRKKGYIPRRTENGKVSPAVQFQQIDNEGSENTIALKDARGVGVSRITKEAWREVKGKDLGYLQLKIRGSWERKSGLVRGMQPHKKCQRETRGYTIL